MKTNKGLILIVVLLSGALFVAFTNNYKTDKVISQKQKLLAKVGELLETQHYSPQDINDAFSKKIFTKFINELDGDKCLFTETDIDALKKYETTLDDEIHGKDEFQFLPALNAVYTKRTDEIIVLYKEILKNPFDFSVDENIHSEIIFQISKCNELVGINIKPEPGFNKFFYPSKII